MCPDCGKPKMQFESECKAQNFIRWNGNDFSQEGQSLRAYYCKACCCWHISHKHYSNGYGRQLENKLKVFEQERGNSGKRLDVLIRSTDLQTVLHQAQEIYPQLDLSNISRKAAKRAVSKFLSEHPEYQDSPALHTELIRMYNKELKKKYGKI